MQGNSWRVGVRPWWLPSIALLLVLASPVGVAGQQVDAKALYTGRCTACHGPTGAGDGPAAAALAPRPASFVDSAFQATRTDQQLTTAITDGKPPMMPGFGRQLSAAEIRSLVEYVRRLGKKTG